MALEPLLANKYMGATAINGTGPIGSTSLLYPTSYAGILNTLGTTPEAVNPTPAYSGNIYDFSGGQTTSSTPTYDYSSFGGQAGLNTQKTNLLDSINQAINQQGQTYGYGVEDLLTSGTRGQDALNTKMAQNDLSRLQGRADILSKVSRGVRSGNVMLGQKNAANSSAAQAIANAYGDIANRDNIKLQQGYKINSDNIATEQKNFGQDIATKARRIRESKVNIVNNIVTEATAKLQALDAQIASASLPDRIAIEQEKNRIRTDATNKLATYDSQLNQVDTLKAYTPEQSLTAAQGLSQAGTAATPLFQATPEQNMQAQTQVDSSGLPLYTLPKRRV